MPSVGVNLLAVVRCVCPIPAGSLPLHYADPSDYEMVCGYRRTLTVPDAPRVFLRFDGAAHQAEIYLNGQLAGQHQVGQGEQQGTCQDQQAPRLP